MLDEAGYILLHDQQDKVMQLYETMMTRHSTMLVGPTGGGKTVVMNALVRAQTHMGLPTKVTIVNPKVNFVIWFVYTSLSRAIDKGHIRR